MKKLFAVLLCLCGLANAQFAPTIPDLAKESSQVVPQRLLDAKTAVLAVRWPGASMAALKDVQDEAEHFMKKWKRYRLVTDLKDADIGILVIVEPITRDAGAFSRAMNAWSQQDKAILLPAPDQTVLAGGVFMYDAAQLRAAGSKAEVPPQLFAIADFHGRKPLVGAGNRLRKMIETAAATTSVAAVPPSHSK